MKTNDSIKTIKCGVKTLTECLHKEIVKKKINIYLSYKLKYVLKTKNYYKLFFYCSSEMEHKCIYTERIIFAIPPPLLSKFNNILSSNIKNLITKLTTII